MNKILIILSLVVLASCGPSAEEKRQVEMEQQRIEQEASEKLAQEKANRIAAVTCSIMGETRNMDAAVRVREMNDAREKIGGEPFLGGDVAIQEAFEWGLCQELVLNKNYDETLQSLKDAKRERERIAAEKQRIADSKPTVKEEFYSEGGLKEFVSFLDATRDSILSDVIYIDGHHKYDYVISISHNQKKIPNKGSAIFIHLTNDYKPTSGCIALKKNDFQIILKLIDKKTKIKIG